MVELFGAVLLLFGLSDLLFRFLGLGAYAHGSRREPKVALTFDDGPSERTEALLALLARHGVKATFSSPGKSPGQAGPGGGHKAGRPPGGGPRGVAPPPLAFPPWVEWRHMAQNPGRYYRPHGLHTPFTRLFARLLGKRVVLWDLESKDWLNLPPRSSPNGFSSTCAPGPSSSSTTGRSAP